MSKQFQSVKKIDFNFRKNSEGEIEAELIGGRKIFGKTAWVDENDDLHLNDVTVFAAGEYTSKAGKQIGIGKDVILNQNWKNILQGKPLLDDHYKADLGLGSVKEVREQNDGTIKADLIVYNDELKDKVLDLELGALSVGGAIGDDGIMSFDHIALVKDPACEKARFDLEGRNKKMFVEKNKDKTKDDVQAKAEAEAEAEAEASKKKLEAAKEAAKFAAKVHPEPKETVDLTSGEEIELEGQPLKEDGGVSRIELSKMQQEIELQKKQVQLLQLQAKATKLGVKFDDGVELVELKKLVDEHSKKIIMAKFGKNKEAAERALKSMNADELALVLSGLPTSKAINTMVDEGGDEKKSYEEITAERAKKMYRKEQEVV